MEEINEVQKSGKRCHIVAVPFPGRGLINPMMNFCKDLAHKLDNNVKITFVVTEEWFGILESASLPSQIHLRSIPNVIPSEFVRSSTLDFDSFLEIVLAKMEAPFEHVLNTSDPTTVIIADFYLMWAISIGNKRNIPVVSFWPSTSFVFSVMYHADLLTKNGYSLANLSDCCDEVIDYIPGISPTRLADMPLLPSGNEPNFNPKMAAFNMLEKVQCLLFVSFYELEPQVTDTLKAIFPFPIYTVGPSISYISTAIEQHHNIDEWLDFQPIGSVLYIAFGSTIPISGVHAEEIMSGIHKSGVRYLLVSRGVHLTSGVHEGGDDKEICTNSRRLVVPWCDQLRVLCHSSIGGFLTHCGWNSVMESLYAGVPMLTFPISFDQIPNRKLIVDDLKVGMKVTKEFGEKAVVKRDDVAKIVNKFMDIIEDLAEEDVNDEAKEMRTRSSELKEMCRRALAKGGSYDTNYNAFVKDILHVHDN
ncbi:hypothetical protein MKW98_001421 [Papaver atlanticum]|uniref:Glycosyltransferase n=1 Tax=Papaver atlanticum TaxID=357466 RepID=A0AAD4SVC3_9MAGN|nr:hypothetical protein MKW98_001421 [Papaver atlanticum]